MRYILIIMLLMAPATGTAGHAEDFENLIDAVSPAIVIIQAEHEKEETVSKLERKPLPPGIGKKKPQPDLDAPEEEEEEDLGTPIALGTGFVIDGGYIITNHHVIDDAIEIRIYFGKDARPHIATLIGADADIDLAVLKLNGEMPPDIIPLQWADNVRQGQDVWTIGHPNGFYYSVTKGIVSAIGRHTMGEWSPALQTDAPINSGNSGGPLLDLHGEVVGVTNALYSRTGSFSGIGLSIQTKFARHAIEVLIEHGEIKRPRLGIMLQMSDTEFKIEAKQVIEGTAADLGGVEDGDLILAVDGNNVYTVHDVFDALNLKAPGDELELIVLRDDDALVFVVTLQAMPDTSLEEVSAGEN